MGDQVSGVEEWLMGYQVDGVDWLRMSDQLGGMEEWWMGDQVGRGIGGCVGGMGWGCRWVIGRDDSLKVGW